jgi:hypothetical protein
MGQAIVAEVVQLGRYRELEAELEQA